MAHPSSSIPARATRLAAACLLGPLGAHAQLAPVTVTGRATPPAAVAGWGDTPIDRLPISATVFGAQTLRDAGAQRLADLVGFDPAVADAYNSEGYWDFLAVRGFTLDNRFNYRRDGLPINAETSIALDNKARVEVLKGTSGLQAGTSAPGGLVNLVVKRPLATPLRSAGVQWRGDGGIAGAIDLSQRLGTEGAIGMRLNAAVEAIDPELRDARGSRRVLAWAGEWRLAPGTLLEAEFESSHRSQPSQPGFSLLGNTVPTPGDPRVNLNNQPWSLPVVFEGSTASLRLVQRLAGDWQATAHAMTQRLRTDDRIAFPFGCTAGDGSYYADRHCPDGSFDLYDFRSENERRHSTAFELSASGSVVLGGTTHGLAGGVLRSQVRNRFQRQAFNYAGSGRIDGSAITSAAPELTDENTNRDEQSTELHLRDAIALAPAWTAWLGARHTRLSRDSVRTDGSRATTYAQSFTTPFAALGFAFAPEQLAYASWGRGIESDVAPNRDRYTNAGQALPTLRSRQLELGLKGRSGESEWNVALFDITRPLATDQGSCDTPGSCTRVIDGSARHRGAEASSSLRLGTWTLRAGAMALRARREGASDAGSNGLVPANVAQRTLRLQADWQPAPGLELSARTSVEGPRFVLPDNSLQLPGWARTDLSARWTTGTLTWRAGADNLFDRRAWRESPYQFGHAYLYPLASRALRVSMQAEL
jgi:iron complex outermembrane receptor protein